MPGTPVASHRTKTDSDYHAQPWCGSQFYSDLVQEGLEWLEDLHKQGIMVYESPSSEAEGTSFVNQNMSFTIRQIVPHPVQF